MSQKVKIFCQAESKDDASFLQYIFNILESTGSFQYKLVSQTEPAVWAPNPLIYYGKKVPLSSPCLWITRNQNTNTTCSMAMVNRKFIHDRRVHNQLIPVRTEVSENYLDEYDIVFLSTCDENKPIIFSIKDKEHFVRFSFDFFYEIFLYVSHYDEYVYEKEHGKIRSYASDWSTEKDYSVPFVNYLTIFLESIIEFCSGIKSSQPELGFTVFLSHDLDYIEKNWAVRVKKLVFNSHKALLHFRKSDYLKAFSFLKLGLIFFLVSTDYWMFDSIQKLEDRYGVRSCFFVYSQAGNILTRGIWSILIDPSYSVKENEKLQNILKNLSHNEWRIGIHGSSNGFSDPDKFAREKDSLEKSLDLPISINRNHWLNFSHFSTMKLLEMNAIAIDSTLGFNDTIGFRGGICSPYRLFDFIENRPYDVIEIPMVIMDGTIFDYLEGEGLERIFSILSEVKKFHGTVSINWHQHTISDDYGWYTLYEEIIQWIQMNGGRCYVP